MIQYQINKVEGLRSPRETADRPTYQTGGVSPGELAPHAVSLGLGKHERRGRQRAKDLARGSKDSALLSRPEAVSRATVRGGITRYQKLVGKEAKINSLKSSGHPRNRQAKETAPQPLCVALSKVSRDLFGVVLTSTSPLTPGASTRSGTTPIRRPTLRYPRPPAQANFPQNSSFPRRPPCSLSLHLLHLSP